MKLLVVVTLIFLGLLIFVGCDDDSSEAEPTVTEPLAEETSDARPAYCDSLASLRTAAIRFDAFRPGTTMDDLLAANEEYAAALEEAIVATTDLPNIVTAPLEEAYADLNQAIDDIPEEEVLQSDEEQTEEFTSEMIEEADIE